MFPAALALSQESGRCIMRQKRPPRSQGRRSQTESKTVGLDVAGLDVATQLGAAVDCKRARIGKLAAYESAIVVDGHWLMAPKWLDVHLVAVTS